MKDFIELKLDDITLIIDFTLIPGYISCDYFEPDEPDEIVIDDIKLSDGQSTPDWMFEYFVNHYENYIIEKIEDYLCDIQNDGGY